MNVVDLSYGQERGLASLDELFARHHTTRGLAEALARHVDSLTVIRNLATGQQVQRDGVRYHLYPSRGNPHWYIPRSLHAELRRMAPDVIHVHGLMFPLQVAALRRALPETTAIIIQHHAERPSTGIKRLAQRLLLPVADGFLFVSEEQAIPWLHAGIIPDRARVFTVMEGSTHFSHRSRTEARHRTGITGDPVLLWVGRLNANKDPLTVLHGFEMIGERFPGARLYMIYHEADMLNDVRTCITGNTFLEQNVVLVGRVERERMEDYYNSADYFISGSHYEGSGFALAEALSCGCIPVVTDIPSFRMITDNGRLGSLWQPGNASACADALAHALAAPRADQSSACIEHFNRTLSFDAIARITVGHYRTIIKGRRSRYTVP